MEVSNVDVSFIISKGEGVCLLSQLSYTLKT